MLNHTYTSVKNANLVDCGKKQHIPSQPTPLLKEKFLGEFRTELDKKKVLANLGIATSLSLEWEYIKGDIGRSDALMQELDSRTKYVTQVGDFKDKVISVIDGIKYLETIVGGEQEGEDEQNKRLTALETLTQETKTALDNLSDYIATTVDVNVEKLQKALNDITEKVDNITSLIQVSAQEGNALSLLEGENPGLYVPDLSGRIKNTESSIETIQADIETIEKDFVKRSEFGDGNLDFVSKSTYNSFSTNTSNRLGALESEIENTVKTGEDGHVDTLYVNKISKDNDSGNIQITDSFEMESGIPLDVRFVVENLEKLCELPANKCYSGMGVIVNSLSALYILRKPAEGTRIDQDYISNIYNWKCPEDLVTVALSRQDYEALEEINPNVFYYIYEEEIKRTQEPKPEEFGSTEEYEKAFQDWVDSLKILSQEYMSAAWGTDIETKLGQKASLQSVLNLSDEVEKLKGGGEGVSLESLSKNLEELKETDAGITQRLDEILNTSGDEESGRIVALEESVENLSKDISDVSSSLGDYVTKEELGELSNDFNFVKPDDYEKDKEAFETALANQLTTQSINLTGSIINVQEGSLCVDSNKLAQASDIPNIEVMSKTEYDNLQNKEENTYYYTYEENTFYVTQEELTNRLASIQTQISTLAESLSALSKIVEELQKLHTSNE